MEEGRCQIVHYAKQKLLARSVDRIKRCSKVGKLAPKMTKTVSQRCTSCRAASQLSARIALTLVRLNPMLLELARLHIMPSQRRKVRIRTKKKRMKRIRSRLKFKRNLQKRSAWPASNP